MNKLLNTTGIRQFFINRGRRRLHKHVIKSFNNSTHLPSTFFSDTHCSYLPCICKCGSNQPENPRRLPDFRFPARNPRRHTALSFYQPHYLFRQNKNIQTSNCISNRTILTLTSKLIECIIFFKLTLDILHHLNTDQQCFPSTNVILSFSR